MNVRLPTFSFKKSRLAFDGAHGDALGEVFLEDQEDDDDGGGGQKPGTGLD